MFSRESRESNIGSPASARKPGFHILSSGKPGLRDLPAQAGEAGSPCFVRHPFLILSLILLLSAALHLVRIGTPSHPVFDEAYFATYAADNALHVPYFDIHPPLGRFLYSVPLFFYDKNDLTEATYVVNEKTPDGTSFTTKGIDKPYERFPYVMERMVSALFGLLLIFSVFLFVRELAGDSAALLTAFFVTLENALLLDTRLILMDGIYLSLGFLALYFFFKKNAGVRQGIGAGEKVGKTLPSLPAQAGAPERTFSRWYWPHNLLLSAIFFGLAVSIKLTAVVFAGPIVVALVLKNILTRERQHRDMLRFFGFAIAVFLVLFVGINGLLFTPSEQLSVMGSLFNIPNITANPSIMKASLYQLLLGVAGYTVGGTNPMMSPWYLWPFMMKPMRFTSSGDIMLIGNIFIWVASTFVVLGTLFKYIKRIARRATYDEKENPIAILLFGYVFALLPFFTFVTRATFLYHYFPALLLAIALLATLITRWLENKTKRTRMLAYGVIGILSVWGFLIAIPYTYGL